MIRNPNHCRSLHIFKNKCFKYYCCPLSNDFEVKISVLLRVIVILPLSDVLCRLSDFLELQQIFFYEHAFSISLCRS